MTYAAHAELAAAQHGHGKVVFRDVRVPVSNLLGPGCPICSGPRAAASPSPRPGSVRAGLRHATRAVAVAEELIRPELAEVLTRQSGLLDAARTARWRSATLPGGGPRARTSPSLVSDRCGLVTTGFFSAHATASASVVEPTQRGRQASALYTFCYYIGSRIGG